MLNATQLEPLHEVLTLKNLEGFSKFKTLSCNKDQPVRSYNPNKVQDEYIYIETSPDSKVLAVAHTDTVRRQIDNPLISRNKRYIKALQLDDRLGCWIILELLRTILPSDLPYDILLTDNEEIGATTANFFHPNKSYNWMFEWDRRGTQVVMYNYESKALRKLLRKYNFDVGSGSFTDIGALSHLGCKGFNFGTGYYNEHSSDCFCDLNDTFSNVEKFVPFYKDNYHVKFSHDTAKVHNKYKIGNAVRYYNSANNSSLGYYNNPTDHLHDTWAGKHKGNSKGTLRKIVTPNDIFPDLCKKIRKVKDTNLRAKLYILVEIPFLDMDYEQKQLWLTFRNEFDPAFTIKKPQGNKYNQLLIADTTISTIDSAKKKVTNKEWTEKQYQNWLDKYLESMEDYNDLDIWDHDLQQAIQRPDAEIRWLEFINQEKITDFVVYCDIYDQKHGKYQDNYNDDDDTLLEGPTIEELRQLSDEEIKSKVMEDPLFAAEEFPGRLA